MTFSVGPAVTPASEAIIILGAKGSLGAAMHLAVHRQFDQMFLFDKTASPDRNIDQCDLSQEASIAAAIISIPIHTAEYWRLLVCSGVYNGDAAPDNSWPLVRQSIRVNLLGACQFILGFIEQLIAGGKKGRVVVVSSAASRVGSHDLGYGISKAGLEGLVRSVSKHYAPDVSIIGVVPGVFNSQMSMSQSSPRLATAIQATHVKRQGSLDEIVSCTGFALLTAPDFMTGTFVCPTGGQVA